MAPVSFDLYNVFMLFGVFQGLLLISIFLFNKNFRKKSNYALVLMLTFLVLTSFGNVLEDIKLFEQYPFTYYFPFYHNFLLPIGLYYYTIFLIDSNYEFKQKDYWFIAPLFIQLTINFGIFFFYLINPDFITRFDEIRLLYYRFSELLMFFYLLYAILFTLKKINLYHEQLFNNYSEVEGKSLYWLRNTTIFIFLLWACGVVSQTYIFLYKSPSWVFYFTWFLISILIYWISYFILLRRDVFEIPTFQNKVTKDQLKPILSDKTEEHYQNILQLIEKEKLYQDAQLNMDTLAEKTSLSNGYLSKIINQKEGKNFYDFINGYRIEEVKLNLTNPAYAHYSILGIGLEAGFKSKSTFNAVFKKMTGMTPSAYKKSLS